MYGCMLSILSVSVSVCMCLLFYQYIRNRVCMDIQYVRLYTVDSVVIWSECVFTCALQCVRVCVCAHGLFFFFFCRRLLERITSFKEYEIQHLLKSDTVWHCFEAMKVRLERHGSSFLSTESWVYVIGLRPVKFPLKRHAPEGETKLPLKTFHLYLF